MKPQLKILILPIGAETSIIFRRRTRRRQIKRATPEQVAALMISERLTASHLTNYAGSVWLLDGGAQEPFPGGWEEGRNNGL